MVKTQRSFLAMAVSILTTVVYLPALRNGFVYDDEFYIVPNEHIRALDLDTLSWAFFRSHESNWHPLSRLSHAIDHAVWGLDPFGHHLTNILLHGANAALVVLLVLALLDGAGRFPTKGPGVSERSMLITAGVTGLLFGLHPIHVESVAWVSERKGLLCGLFTLLGLLQYGKYTAGMRGGDSPDQQRPRLFDRYYRSTLVWFLLALMSKPMAVSFPIVLLVLDWHPYGRAALPGSGRALVIEKLPFLALALCSALITLLIQGAGSSIQSTAFAPLSIRALVVAQSYMAYLGKMLMPLNLLPLYPYPRTASLLDPAYFLPILLMAVITAFCVVNARKRPAATALWAYYLVTLLPVIGIVQVGAQAMADRYTYLPGIGPFLAAGLAISRGLERTGRFAAGKRAARFAVPVLAVCAIAVLSVLTIRQISIWKSDLDLWTRVVEKGTEPNYIPYYNRATTHLGMDRPEQAILDLTAALALRGDWYSIYNNRALAYAKLGRFDKAVSDYDQALSLHQDGSLFRNRGFANLQAGRLEQAIVDFESACGFGDDFGCTMLRSLNRGGQ
ncbi:MAG: tetratricopeptide repeat protein [Nitrospirota bacterium]